MSELLNVRCKQGKLIITETHIIVELGNFRSETMLRTAFVGLDSKMAVPSIFGLGGGTNLIFHGQGSQDIHADLIPPKEVKKIQALLLDRS